MKHNFTLLQAGRSCFQFPIVIVIFHWHNPSDRTMAPRGQLSLLTEMSTRNISCGIKAAGL